MGYTWRCRANHLGHSLHWAYIYIYIYICDRLWGPCFHQITLPIYKHIRTVSTFTKCKFEILKLEVENLIFELSKCYFALVKFVIFSPSQRLICSFSNRGEKVSMGHFKEIEIGFENITCFLIGSKKGSTLCWPINKKDKHIQNQLQTTKNNFNQYMNI